MNTTLQRRTFLEKMAAGALGLSIPAGRADPSSEATPPVGAAASLREVRLERVRPRELDQAMQACPVLFQPLGTIEWHGLHNVVGLDAVQRFLTILGECALATKASIGDDTPGK